jgi:succinate dehydrogenase/fumarate reductase flavoprotein subunit
MIHSVTTDVLVVGGGGGGAMAAYEAAKSGARVTMVVKGQPQRCGSTIMAPGAIAAVGHWRTPPDSPDVHFRDTVRGGAFLNEQRLVRIMVEEIPELVVELERIGALWERGADGRTYDLRTGGGHSHHRSVYLEDRTGREMLRTLMGELAKRNVRVVPQVMILRLLQEDNQVVGALGLDLRNTQWVLFRARAVVMACGGAGNLYENTDNPADVTGDGYALALEAGAVLQDMEFVQFFPLGFVFPHSLRGALAGLPYYVHLRNIWGERFMERYDPERMELSTRDKVSRAMGKEIREGRGTAHGGVLADMTFHEPGFIQRMQPALYRTYRQIGVNPEKDYLEVAPTCHFFMGGARVDEDWQSTVPGLFMVGENAAGIHGANRLSQNALAELLVSGRRAGKGASRFSAGAAQAPVDPARAKEAVGPVNRLLKRQKGVSPALLRNNLRRIMWEQVGVYRTAEGLREALGSLRETQQLLSKQCLTLRSKRLNHELVEALENHFLAVTSRCVTEAALKRTESRGAHFREDFASTDPKRWLQHLAVQKREGRLRWKRLAVDLQEIQPQDEGE